MAQDPDRKLDEILMESGVAELASLKKAQRDHKGSAGGLAAALVAAGAATEEAVCATLGKRLNIPFMMLSKHQAGPEATALVPRELAEKHGVVPLDLSGNTLTMAVGCDEEWMMDELSKLTQKQAIPVIAYKSDIDAAIEKYYA